MRIAFMGTPDFAVRALDALARAGHEIVAVYTQPPRPANRGRLTPTPVHLRAEALGLPVRTPLSLKPEEEKAAFTALELDCAVVAAYGLLLPKAVLEAPRHGCLNIHASLLPRWRGAAPIHRAVMAGDAETGVTIMQMEAGLDTGPMLHKAIVQVGRKTTGELFGELGAVGAAAMVEVPASKRTEPPAGGRKRRAAAQKRPGRVIKPSPANLKDKPYKFAELSRLIIKFSAYCVTFRCSLHIHTELLITEWRIR